MKADLVKRSHWRVYAHSSTVGVPLACFMSLVLSGCTASPGSLVGSAKPPADTVAGTAITGRVHGGQTPVSGASVYLFAANPADYGQQSISLLNDNVLTQNPPGGENGGNYYATTDSNGDFAITNDYTCPSSKSQVYLYAVGGSAGSGSNSAIGMLAGLGSCGTLFSDGATYPFIYVNEVSTIATAYAIAGYATSATAVSSSGTNLAVTGIENAFAAIPNLEDTSTGLARATTPAGNGTVPQAEINTLANILAGCVNSTGSGSSGCTMLFGAAKNGSGTEPTDTATAAINIAHNPGANISTLWNISTASAPFQTPLSMQPNDFTIAIEYTGSGLSEPPGVAIDAAGDVWITNNKVASITELSPVGAPVSMSEPFTGGGLDEPTAIAIDISGNVWVTNDETMSEFNSSGMAINGSPISGGDINFPFGVAIDTSQDAWVTNPGNDSITVLSSGGTILDNYTTGGLNGDTGIAIDVSGNAWVANDYVDSVSEFSSSGAASTNSPISAGGLDEPALTAIDASGNVWATNSGDNSITELSSSGMAVGTSPFTGGGLNVPIGVAIDGNGNVWVGNFGSTTISEFNSGGTAITGSAGFKGGGVDQPDGIAIDGSGNLWVANTASNANSVTEFVGIAAPVVTPMVANLMTTQGYGVHAVNKP